MNSLSLRQSLLVILFAVLIMLTRGQHFASFNLLPDASWSVFMLIGFYLSRYQWLFVFTLFTVLLDFVSIYWGGASSYCISPAYLLLLPSYFCLWFAGKWYRKRLSSNWQTLFPLVGSATIATLLATIFSSGGFYLFSGRYPAPDTSGFITSILRYFPAYLENAALYLLLAASVHIVLNLMLSARKTTKISQQ